MDTLGFEVDPEIARASTPPARLYTEATLFERAKQRVFAPSWQLVADTAEVDGRESVHPVTLLADLLPTPLVLTRDRDGTLRALSNVCTHRANLVVCESGKRRSLVCGYHGRSFGLDGRMLAMPGFEGAEGFPGASDDLPTIPVATLGPLVFASLGGVLPFERWTADLVRRMAWFPMDEWRFDASRSREYSVAANWALYCDNYLEGFHIPFVHAALDASVETHSYATELFEASSVQIAFARAGENSFDDAPDAPGSGKRVAAYYWFLFPNLMLNFYPWGLSINVVRPLAVDRTRISFLTYVSDPAKLDRGAGANLDRVEREDEAVVEAVQRGVRSGLHGRGRYSPAHERAVHHFHRMLVERLR
jgi:choline monooxygenase